MRVRVNRLLLCLALACSRVEEAPWVVETPELPLLASLTLAEPEESTLEFERSPGSTFEVTISHEVKTRGRMLPAMVTSLTSRLKLSTARAEDDSLDLTVVASETEMDPDIASAVEEMTDGFALADLRIHLGPPLKVTRRTKAALAPQERVLAEVLTRLLPSIPAGDIAVGDSWPFEARLGRAPAGGEGVVVLQGQYALKGVTEFDDETLAVITLEYTLEATGASNEGKVNGVLTGSGKGRGVFLVAPNTGDTRRAQVSEASRFMVQVHDGRHSTFAEQFATMKLDLSSD